MKLKFFSLSLCCFWYFSIQIPAIAGFAVRVTPPRFELQSDPGKKIRQKVTLTSTAKKPGYYLVKTSDWGFDKHNSVVFYPTDKLMPNSCRPWVRIERRRVRLTPRRGKKYRFAINVPKDAAVGECRFALIVSPETKPEPPKSKNSIGFPVVGQIGIIVYVKIGNAKPQLTVEKVHMDNVQGEHLPVAVMFNSGNAHGRPQGTLNGKDSLNGDFNFAVAPFPILPNHRYTIPLWPNSLDGKTIKKLAPPIKIKGVIEWEGGRYQVDKTL